MENDTPNIRQMSMSWDHKEKKTETDKDPVQSMVEKL